MDPHPVLHQDLFMIGHDIAAAAFYRTAPDAAKLSAFLQFGQIAADRGLRYIEFLRKLFHMNNTILLHFVEQIK